MQSASGFHLCGKSGRISDHHWLTLYSAFAARCCSGPSLVLRHRLLPWQYVEHFMLFGMQLQRFVVQYDVQLHHFLMKALFVLCHLAASRSMIAL